MSPVVTIQVNSKTFPAVGGQPAKRVLKDIRLEIEDGSFVVVTGPSGCGKTTMLNVVAGLDDDYAGAVTFRDRAPKISYMFQSPRLLPWRTIYQNIALVLDKDVEDPHATIMQILERVGLRDSAHAYPERISLGMQRRASLARAFVLEPDILLMDEPFVSLDEPSARALRGLLLDMWSRRPTTVLFVTHDRMEAARLGTRLVRVAGTPAGIVQDTPVDLGIEARKDDDAVMAEQKRLFADGAPELEHS